MLKFSGAEYLMMDIAARFGADMDKAEWDVRLKWFNQNKTKLRELVPQAEEPASFLAGVIAYEKALKGEPTGYTIQLDASASGMQILALLSGCKKSAQLCNIVNNGKRNDAYTLIYDALKKLVSSQGMVTRKQAKIAVMTSLYGSKQEPKNIFGDETPELAAFYTTMKSEAPGAWQLNEDIIGLWQPEATVNEYPLPDGFEVKLKVIKTIQEEVFMDGQKYLITKHVNEATEFGVSLGANVVHSIDGMIVREIVGRCNYDHDHISSLVKATVLGSSTTRGKDIKLMRLLELARNSMFYSVRLFNYMDTDNMGLLSQEELLHVRSTMNAMLQHKPFEVLTIHDCFRVLPNNGNWLRYHAIQVYGQVADSELMSHIASHITKKKVQVAKLSYDLGDLVRASEYIVS